MKKQLWCSLLLISNGLIWSQSVAAKPTYIALNYANNPLEVKLLTNSKLARFRQDVITADTISPRQRNIPSLWWTREQLPNKLVINWLAYPQKKYIDVVVNPQFWNILDYPERYQLVNRWGTVARKHGFDVRIFNLRFSELKPIVAYTCTHDPTDQRCVVQWQGVNQDSLGVKSSRY
jgi:hypothetical protein